MKDIIELVEIFGNVQNVPDLMSKYILHYESCTKCDLTIIFYDKNYNNTHHNLGELFKNKHLTSFFPNGNLLFFNKDIIDNGGSFKNLKLDYTISFESNTASYVNAYINNDFHKIPKNFFKDINLIINNNYNIDIFYYLYENFAKPSVNKDIFRTTVFNLKKLLTCDINHFKKTKKIESLFQDHEIIKKTDNLISTFENKEFINHIHKIHQLMKIILLCTLIAKNKYQNKDMKYRYKYVLDFMHNKLNAIFQRELHIASYYFNNPLPFFDPSNNRNDFEKFIKNIDNMAWDYTLIRLFEYTSTLLHSKEAPFHIPFLFSYDQKFLNMQELYTCKSIIYYKENKYFHMNPIPINSLKEIFEKFQLAESYLTKDAILERKKKINPSMDLTPIYDELKMEVKKRLFR